MLKKWMPKNFKELLNERIKFCNTFLSIEVVDNSVASEFAKKLVDLKYCKKLSDAYKKTPDDANIVDRYKKLALRILMDAYGTLQEQGNGYESAENKDYSDDLSLALEKIFIELNVSIKHF